MKKEKGERFNFGTIMNWVIQMLNALEYLNQHGIIHRDLKPE